jgi:hypothetical protein
VGLIEPRPADENALLGRWGGGAIRWPEGIEAQLSAVAELHNALEDSPPRSSFLDLDVFILSVRSVRRRKIRTSFLIGVMGLVCANFIQNITFSLSEGGVAFVVTEHWELPLAAGFMSLLIFLNLTQISLYERLVEVGTIRALGAETTTTLYIFAVEGMIIGAIGALVGYVIVAVANIVVKFGGIDPTIDLAMAIGPGKGFLGLFLGLTVGFIGSVLPVFFVVWTPPEKCLAGPK